ncbi:MAG TPA: PD-(D/E)XK nuclease family protein [Gaiellaceae bacterium]
MSASLDLARYVTERAISLDELRERLPRVRQSSLSLFDDCELASLFGLRYENGWSTHPQAAGTIVHRAIAECLREMQRADSETIPVGVALAILEETLRQRDVAPEDRVRVPRRELPNIEMAVRKFAVDNQFTIRNLIDVERRLEATVSYRDAETGELVERVVSGQLDALIARPPDEAVVLDWKATWALPPEHDEDDESPSLSYHGFFQQRFYAVLVMQNFPAVNAVVLREFYVRRTKARPARITRQDLPKTARWLAEVVEDFDMALRAGPPPRLRTEDLERHGHWKPSPGKHCFNCHKAHLCPIDDDYKDGGIRTPEQAAIAAGARQKARAIKKRLDEYLKPWVELHGPIPLKAAKGRRVLGFRKIKGGVRFEEYTPQAGDRPPDQEAYAPNLVDAMQESVDRARQERAS